MPNEIFVKVNGEFVPVSSLESKEMRICSGCKKPMELDEKLIQLYVNIIDSKSVGNYHGEIHESCFPAFCDRIREMETHRW